MCKVLVLFSFFFAALSLQGAITVTSISGASNFDLVTSVNKTLKIYGGTSGEITDIADSSVVYNSCLDSAMGTTTPDCNEKRIFDALPITITFSSSDKIGNVSAVASDGTTVLTPNSPAQNVPAGASTSITFTWSALCAAMDSTGSGCEDRDGSTGNTPINGSIKIGIDTDNNLIPDDLIDVFIRVWEPVKNIQVVDCTTVGLAGVCNLAMFPGDEKAYIDENTAIESATSFPTISGDIVFTHLRIFFKQGSLPADFDSLFSSSNGAFKADFALLDDSKSIESGIIDGLTNDLKYVFRFASVDQAGNISNHQSNAHFVANTNNFVVTPSEVFGLLREDFNCFITTASYNSFMHPKVKTFRAFRNKFLLTQSLGKSFVKSYYKYGPFGARFLNKHPTLKPFTRFLLWPMWLFAKLSLSIGVLLSLLIYALVLFFVFTGVKKSYNKLVA